MPTKYHQLAVSHLQALRAQSPLVHNITNFVAMNITANALLAIGALPVMAHAPEEVQEITVISSSLVLNIGTIDASWRHAMHDALMEANTNDLPVVIDPVGVGASSFRMESSLRLMQTAQKSIIRGNASEIMALGNAGAGGKGVDSTDNSADAVSTALLLAKQYNCTVCVSGECDFIVDELGSVARVEGGSPLMPRVTGMGCTATALTGAFAAVAETPFTAAISAMAIMSAAGTMAAAKAQGPGTFLPHFLDALYTVQQEDILRCIRISAVL